MPVLVFTLPHIQITASGTLGTGGGNEIFSFGYKIGCSNVDTANVLEVPTQDDVDQAADNAVTNISALIAYHGAAGAGGGSIVNSWVGLNRVDAAAIDSGGKRATDRNTAIRDFPVVRGGAPSGTADAYFAQLPYPVAVVATLRGSTYRRGPAAYGRFYIPGPNCYNGGATSTPNAMVDGLMSVPSVTSFATAAALLVQNSKILAMGSGLYQRVWNVSSSVIENQVRAQYVDSVAVDNRPDTVRRRSNRLSGEGRVTVEIT